MKTNLDLYGFKFATGDVNYLTYGATWYRHVAGTREYHFVTLVNWEDSVSEREAREVGSKYCMDLAIVDLDELSQDRIISAFRLCGQTPEEAGGNDEWIADTCRSYGAYAPIASENTSNFHAMFRKLAKESRRITGSAAERRKVMARKVNKLGSTAAEFMRGDLNSALIRGVIAGDKRGLLVAKISGLEFSV